LRFFRRRTITVQTWRGFSPRQGRFPAAEIDIIRRHISQRLVVAPAVDWSRHPYDYQTASDGKESNTAGAALRLRRDKLHYL